MKLEYEVKGVTLEAREIVAVHEYYKNYTMAEYLNANYNVDEDKAFKYAPVILHLIEEHGYTEYDAIQKILNEEKEND